MTVMIIITIVSIALAFENIDIIINHFNFRFNIIAAVEAIIVTTVVTKKLFIIIIAIKVPSAMHLLD